MENRILRNFLTVAREENITVAADKLHVSQSALSRQMKGLEEELGQMLFVRQPHCVTLTNEGKLLVKRAGEILQLVSSTTREFRNLSNEVRGEIYIGAVECPSLHDIAKVLMKFHAEYPNVLLHIHSCSAEGSMRRLDQGLIDFAFILSPADFSKYHIIPTGKRENWGLILSANAPLASKKIIEPSDIKSIPLLMSRQILSTVDQNNVRDWVGCDFSELNITGTFNLIYNATLMVQHGLGSCLHFDSQLSPEANLCFRPLFPTLNSELILTWKRNKLFSTPAQLLLDMFHKEFADKAD